MRKKRNRKKYFSSKFSYTYGEFLVLLPCCRESHQLSLLDALGKAERPEYLLGKPVPQNLNTITYGQLDDLSRAAQSADPAARCIEVIMGLTSEQIYSLNIWDVYGFINFCTKELERINKLFLSIHTVHTSEEKSAGVDQLKFGTFGVVDWYARRMGITNQDEVYDVAWVRIFTCMKNDNMQNQYERRLRDIYIQNATNRRGIRR